jgi:hypothetical protein
MQQLAQNHVEEKGEGWNKAVETAKGMLQQLPQWSEREQRTLSLIPPATLASVIQQDDCKSLIQQLNDDTQRRLHDALQVASICDWIREQKDDAAATLIHKTLASARRGHSFPTVAHGSKTCVVMRTTPARMHVMPVGLARPCDALISMFR